MSTKLLLPAALLVLAALPARAECPKNDAGATVATGSLLNWKSVSPLLCVFMLAGCTSVAPVPPSVPPLAGRADDAAFMHAVVQQHLGDVGQLMELHHPQPEVEVFAGGRTWAVIAGRQHHLTPKHH